MMTIARVAILAFFLPSIGFAQVDLQNRLSNPVRFTGEIGSLGELYSVSGREQRRPSSTGRLYVRSQLQLFNTVTVNFDLLYSTETGSGVTLGSTGRQSLNQIGIAPEWKWGRAYAGSFHDSYSQLTYDGVSVRGGGFNINPGPLRLAVFTGRAQSAVPGGAVDGAYQRRMTGGKIGLGRRTERGESGFFDVVFMRTADDPASLPAPVASTDDSGIQTGNPYAVTPEENVVVAAVTRVPLWQQRLIVSGEVAASIYSRDRRAPVLSDEALDEYSSLLRSFITPRASTYGDFAHNGKLELRNLALPGSTSNAPRMLSATVGYRYVGAGYVSLGVASLPADQRALDGRASLRFRSWNASVQGMLQEDNLLGQKLATTTRSRLGVNVTFRPLRALSSSLRFGVHTMNNDIDDADRQVDFASYTFGMTQSVNLTRGLLRSVAFNYGYQQAGDDNPLKAGSHLRAHDASVRTTLDISRAFSLIPAIGLAHSQIGDADADLRHTYSVAAQHRPQGSRWASSLSLSNSRLHAGGSIQAALSSRFRMTDADNVTFSLRSNRVSGLETATGEFHENTLSIQWSRTIR
jgi:hypothetical protein